MVLFFIGPFDGLLNGRFHSENFWPLVMGISFQLFLWLYLLCFSLEFSLEILVFEPLVGFCTYFLVCFPFFFLVFLTFWETYLKLFSYHIWTFIIDYYTFNLPVLFLILWLFLFFCRTLFLFFRVFKVLVYSPNYSGFLQGLFCLFVCLL